MVVGNTSISELSPGSKTAAGSTIHKTEWKVLPYWPGRIGGQQKNRKWGNKVLCNATLHILCWGLNNIFSIWKWRMIIAVNFQFKQLERRSLKISRLQRDSNPWLAWYRCDALPTKLMKPHIWSEANLLSSYNVSPVRSEMMWSIYEIIHIWTAVVDESEEWSLQ